jgi:hypothetical protein
MTLSDWSLLVFFSLFMAILAALQDVYALVRDRKRWVPINPPPYALGDEYHYFSLLNLLHRRLLNVFGGSRLDVIRLAAITKFQIVGYLFNLLPYHAGYILYDRRLGILLVRIWNTSWLMLALMVLAKLLFDAFQLKTSLILLALSASVYFVLYPLCLTIRGSFPWITPCGNSIWRNLLKNDHIFNSAATNDLQRAMHMGTTGHLFLWATALLFWCFGQQFSNDFFYLVPAPAGMMLFFLYTPVAIVYGFIYLASLVANHQFMFAGIWMMIAMGITAVYFRALFKDKFSKEMFVHNDSEGRVIAINYGQLGNVVIVLILPLLSYAIFKDEVTNPAFWVIYFCSAIFVVSNLGASHQSNRFWQRGALVVYQLFVVVTGIVLFVRHDPCCWEWISSSTLLFLISALSFYFYRNAVFLFDESSTRSPEWIDAQQLSRDSNNSSKLIATDSIEIGFYTYLYSGNSCLLQHYSIQNQGYKEHLKTFCLNFKIVGYELNEVLELFSRHIQETDWVLKRMEAAHNPYAVAMAKIYTFQFMATYMEFNQLILDENAFDKYGWTDHGRAIISTIWHETETRTAPPTTVIIIDANGGLHAALRAQPNVLDVAAFKYNISNNFFIFDGVLQTYENNHYLHKILSLLRLPYCITSEIYSNQTPKLNNQQYYFLAIKKIILIIFLKRKLSSGESLVNSIYFPQHNDIESHRNHNVQVLRSRSLVFKNVLLLKKIVSVLFALYRSGCLRTRGYLVDDAIEAVLLNDQVDLSGVDIGVSENIVDYYAHVVKRALDQGIKVIRVEYFFLKQFN